MSVIHVATGKQHRFRKALRDDFDYAWASADPDYTNKREMDAKTIQGDACVYAPINDPPRDPKRCL